MNRRGFLRNAGRGLVAASAPVLPGAAAWAHILPTLEKGAAGLTGPQWETLAAVQDHLLPSEPQAPGAREVQATAYIYYALTRPDAEPDDRTFIRNGLVRLQRVIEAMVGNKPFPELNEEQRESALRALETDEEGRLWLSEMLQFLLEALLADPLYNANPGGIGWRWLDHTPGFPQPVGGKEYYRLRPVMNAPANKV